MQTDLNPFVYSRPIAPDDVVDRDEETRKLLALAAGGHYVRLYAPRRYGKTSLLRRVLAEGERSEGLVAIMVDLFGVLSLADITVRIERAYAAQLKGPLRSRVDEFLQRTGLGLSLSAVGIGVRLQLDPRRDPLPALHTLLDLPTQLGKTGGRRALIVFDEFQDIGRINDADGILRSHLQHQGDVASYVFAGSEEGLLRELFEQKARPLYGQAMPMRLERLASADIAAYVFDRFTQTGRAAGPAVGPLVEAAQGHPQRAMLLAHGLWNAVERGSEASLEDWERTYARTLLDLQPEFEAHWQRFSTIEKKTLRAVLESDGTRMRRHVLERLEVEKSAVNKALKRLQTRAEVELADERYVLVDPLFGRWIERMSATGELPLVDEPATLV
jgi:uncharacterized protein